jgi:hypothetical protein
MVDAISTQFGLGFTKTEIVPAYSKGFGVPFSAAFPLIAPALD